MSVLFQIVQSFWCVCVLIQRWNTHSCTPANLKRHTSLKVVPKQYYVWQPWLNHVSRPVTVSPFNAFFLQFCTVTAAAAVGAVAVDAVVAVGLFNADHVNFQNMTVRHHHSYNNNWIDAFRGKKIRCFNAVLMMCSTISMRRLSYTYVY